MQPLSSRGVTAGSIFTILICFFISACAFQKNTEPIEDNVAFPGKLLTISDSEFLLLNTNASNKYTEGSIQRYQIDQDLKPVLQNTFLIDTHGSDIALSVDKKLLALSFDGSKKDTKILLYDFSNALEPQPLPELTLDFAPTGSKQSIKQLNFFKVDAEGLEGYYYLYGVILTSPQDTGVGAYIPDRTFVAQIAPDLSSSKVLFVLSYGINEKAETQTLLPKSNSLKQDFGPDAIQYMIGSTAPTYDATHKLFIAFPTGSMNGFNNVDGDDINYDVDARNRYPQLPKELEYFSGRADPNLPCAKDPKCLKPDLRAVSLFAVDMVSFLKNINNTPLDLSVYFVPLAWNINGIPFGYKTNNSIINIDSGSSDDIKSFKFQSGFWASYMLESDSPICKQGKEKEKCLFVGKYDRTYEGDKGNGNDILQISGFEILAKNIEAIKESDAFNDDILPDDDTSLDDDTPPNGPKSTTLKDFASIATRQIIDPYHLLKENLSSSWPINETTKIKSPGPLSPYIYSRTLKSDGKNAFITSPTAVYNFGVVCSVADISKCFPYWVRATYLGLGSKGLDTSWLTVNTTFPLTDKTIYNDATDDPTHFATHAFKGVGAQVCTAMGFVPDGKITNQNIYCANFLTGEFSVAQLTTDASGDEYKFIAL